MDRENKRRSFLKYLLPVMAFGSGTLLSCNRNKSQEHRIQALEAIHDCKELMGRYFHYHTAFLNERCWDELFAHKAPDVSAEIADMGKWEGPEHVKRLYYEELAKKSVGVMLVHAIDTPCIQVAGDLKTAKGVWFSPGHETMVDPKRGKAQAMWCWSYYGTDFIKEDGEWKM